MSEDVYIKTLHHRLAMRSLTDPSSEDVIREIKAKHLKKDIAEGDVMLRHLRFNILSFSIIILLLTSCILVSIIAKLLF